MGKEKKRTLFWLVLKVLNPHLVAHLLLTKHNPAFYFHFFWVTLRFDSFIQMENISMIIALEAFIGKYDNHKHVVFVSTKKDTIF